MEWGELFKQSAPPLEIIVRGSVIYWALFFLFRFVLRRDIGSIGIADVLFVVLVADAAQNAMIGDSHSITDGIILIATLAAWNRLFDWINYRYPALRSVMEPPPLLLVRDGRILSANLKKEQITKEELLAKIRETGIDQIGEVSKAFLESDGEVSVIPRKKKKNPQRPRESKIPA